MATWQTGHNKGTTARNRKLPPDDVIHGLLEAGLTAPQIARRLGLNSSNVTALAKARGWTIPARSPARAMPASLAATATKAVIIRPDANAGRNFHMEEVRISLPRITALHGAFVPALEPTL